MTPAQFAKIQKSGLPAALTAALRKLGASAADIAAIGQSLRTAKPLTATVSFPAVLTSPQLAKADSSNDAALRAYAKSVPG